MKDDMEVATPKPIAEVQAAQLNIIRQARKLQEAGEIIMSAGDSSDYV
jgi:flagellar motor switch protein FliG